MTGTDVKFALRAMRRQPGAALLVVGMLALGIAANVVVFSLMNGLFLKPFPFPQPDRLVYVNERAPKWNLETTGIHFPDYALWRKSTQAFDGIALYWPVEFNIADESGAQRVEGAMVTRNFADVLGVQPIAGRMFSAEEDAPGGRRVVLIAESLWRERYNADTNLAGKTLRLNGVQMEIVGVLPAVASFPEAPRVWLTIQGNPNAPGLNYQYSGIGRLKAGVTIAAAEQDLLRAHAPSWDVRDKDKAVTPYVQPLRERFVSGMRTSARAMTASVTLLLLVTCANIAAIMLARAVARRREMGIRLAVGAGRWRLLRQLLVENMLLALAGGAIGIALGRWALRLLVASGGSQLPRWVSFDFDFRVAAFSLLITLITAVLFGWAPALHALGGDLRSTMTDAVSGSTSSPRGARTLSWLVAAEFTLATVLLVSGGLLWRAFDQVKRVDPGFQTSNLLTFVVGLPPAIYRDNPARLAFWNRALERIRALPGVQQAGLVTCAPLSNCHQGNFFNVEGRRPLAPGEPNPVVLQRSATDGYLETMGIRLASGRAFQPGDGTPEGPRVTIVNESFVKAFWPDATPEQAVGRRIAFMADVPQWITVVGVTRDVKHYGIEVPMRPGVYFPLPAQTRPAMTFALRTAGDPGALGPAVQSAFRELDPGLALYRIRTGKAMVDQGLQSRRLYSWMLGVFAMLALVLAVGGTYGVTSYLVSQRRREIGIRLAVGAGQRDVVRGVLARNAMAVIPAVALGIVAAVLLARQMRDLLFGVPVAEPLVLSVTAVVMLSVALAANFIPARRAARADLIASLKT